MRKGFIALAVAMLAGAGLVQAAAIPVAPVPAQPVPVSPPSGPANSPDEFIEEAPPAPGEVPTVILPSQAETEAEAEPPAPEPTVSPVLESEPESDTPRPRFNYVVVQALDKITAESVRFRVPVDAQEMVRWRGLLFRARACETTAPDETVRDHFAYLEIQSQPRGNGVRASQRRVFQGWMSATAPALNPLEHPIYDAWVVACDTSSAAS